EPTPDTFRSVAVVGLHTDPRVAESMRALSEHLASRKIRIIVDGVVDVPLAGSVERMPEADFAQHADLLVAIGGDGTMLRAARLASAANRPLLGVNRGRLGFLADISPNDISQRIDDVLDGRYVREHRAMLTACIERDGVALQSALALNDVVLQKWETGRMIDFETWIDGQYVNTHGGDGLIVATSTGSTAYALSCGGPILHPSLEASVVVPICPHTLSDRPLVVGSAARIEVRLVHRPNVKAQVTCDGFMLGDVELQDRLVVGPAANRVTLLHPPGHDFYRILRSKLHWGRGGQKERET
ncbi:MAG TPA: NAD(+) kinase, partial [Steroidobacteraceae bacterium]|nr:NAD(+) kinase [Steroidobacteraceae bacterium]